MVCAPVRRDNPRALARGVIDRTAAQTMLYLTCITITSVDLAHYGVSRAKDWVSVDCGTNYIYDGFKGSVPHSLHIHTNQIILLLTLPLLDESICHFRGVESILSLLCFFLWKILLANNVNPDQTPLNVASDLGLQCLPLTFLRVSMKD